MGEGSARCRQESRRAGGLTYLGQGWKGTPIEGVVKSGDSNFGIFLEALSLLLLWQRTSSMNSDDIICQYLTKRDELAANGQLCFHTHAADRPWRAIAP